MTTPRPCTTLETHQWHGETTYLSLAGSDGWLDAFRAWSCARCGLHVWATGALAHDSPPLTPVQWQTQADRQHAEGDLYGRVAHQQEAWERQQRGVSRRLREDRR